MRSFGFLLLRCGIPQIKIPTLSLEKREREGWGTRAPYSATATRLLREIHYRTARSGRRQSSRSR
jgi:hypothetical protein